MNMDRALKERIIGAIVLVLFVVLVVPVFLDGPNNSDAVISQNVPLPGQSGDANQTIVLNRDRDQPVPAANNNRPAETEQVEDEPAPTTEQSESRPQPQTPAPVASGPAEEAEPEPEPEQEQAPPAQEISSTGMWAVQLGSFGDQDNANKLAADLRKQNFSAFLSKVSTDSGELHRVRIGPLKDRESAESVAEQLQKAGHTGQVVPHP